MALDGAPPGDGHRLIVEVFTETEGQARIATGLIDVRRESDGTDSWRIAGARGLAAVDGLYRLRVNPSAQFAAKNFTISSEDLVLTLGEGTVFQVESEEGVTGLVLLGRGMMRFSPAPETERGQLRIFSGDDVLNAPFETAFIRFSPSDYGDLIGAGLAPAPVDPRPLRRAQDLLALEGPKSFNMDLDRYSPELWYLLPTPGDFLAEIQTKRHGTLTYLRAADMPEDVNLFDRSRSLNIAIYPSARRLATRGLSYSEDESSRYDILDYNIETTMFPEREFINGRARLRIRARVGLSAFSFAPRRNPRRHAGHERGVRPSSAPTRPQSGHRRCQPADGRAGRRGIHTRGAVRRKNPVAESRYRGDPTTGLRAAGRSDRHA